MRPQSAVSDGFKEIKGWKQAQPLDDHLPDKWWEIFKDAELNALEAQVNGANQSIAQAEALDASPEPVGKSLRLTTSARGRARPDQMPSSSCDTRPVCAAEARLPSRTNWSAPSPGSKRTEVVVLIPAKVTDRLGTAG